MPLSQVDLTASHLPASCSFYLSALNPLGYRCLGQRGKDIAFGVDDIEFFLSQKESKSISPTKVAFSARSRQAVDSFFFEALRAGGKHHISPADREDESSYYSASILDLDGHQIEAMYRHEAFRAPSSALRSADDQRIAKWQQDMTSNANGQDGRYQRTDAPRVIVNNISTTPAVEVHRIKPESKENGEVSTRAIISTILGASAGAAVAYAMAKGEEGETHHAGSQIVHTIEAPPQRFTEVIYDSPKSTHSTNRGIELIDREADCVRTKQTDSGSRVKTVASSHRPSHAGSKGAIRGSHTGRTIAETRGTKILSGEAEKRLPPSQHSKVKTARSSGTPPQASVHGTTVRSAKDVPLPPSRVSTNLTPATNNEGLMNDLATVVPDDSISQVSTKRSFPVRNKSGHHQRHSSSGHASRHRKRGSIDSNRTVRQTEKHSGHASTHRR